jgi:uncharacterized membrane protein YoaK (UPF0700 family)
MTKTDLSSTAAAAPPSSSSPGPNSTNHGESGDGGIVSSLRLLLSRRREHPHSLEHHHRGFQSEASIPDRDHRNSLSRRSIRVVVIPTNDEDGGGGGGNDNNYDYDYDSNDQIRDNKHRRSELLKPEYGDDDYPYPTPPHHEGVVHYHHYHRHDHDHEHQHSHDQQQHFQSPPAQTEPWNSNTSGDGNSSLIVRHHQRNQQQSNNISGGLKSVSGGRSSSRRRTASSDDDDRMTTASLEISIRTNYVVPNVHHDPNIILGIRNYLQSHQEENKDDDGNHNDDSKNNTNTIENITDQQQLGGDDGHGHGVGNSDSSQDEEPVQRPQKKLLYVPGKERMVAAMKKKSPMHDKYSYTEHVFVVVLGLVLSFNSGFSNGVCLSGFLTPNDVEWNVQSTSGVTGTYTVSALALAEATHYQGNNDDEDSKLDLQGLTNVQWFGYQISIILCMICGSTISAILNPRPFPWRVAPMYAPTLLIGAFLMCMAALGSSFDAYTDTGNVHYFFFLVAAANGVQNGVSSMYTANLIRTTHLTGTSTDIGLFIGQIIRGNNKNLWKLQILVGLAAAFWLGGFTSFFAVKAWTEYTLLVNACIFLLICACCITFLVRDLHLPIHRAILGSWHWQHTLHKLNFRSSKDGTPTSTEILQEAFDGMDEDQDGYIDANDLFSGLRRAGLNLKVPKSTVDLMFEVADRDNDGLINMEEFQDLVQGQHVLVG